MEFNTEGFYKKNCQTSPDMVKICQKLDALYINKGKAVPLQAWSVPEGTRELRFPDFMTPAQDGGKVVSFTHGPPLPPGNTPGTQHKFL